MKYFLTLLLAVSAAFSHAQQPGTLDKSYGTANTGTVVSAPINLFLIASAIQPDDKIVLGGSDNTSIPFIITRNNKDGSLDTSFGKGGQTTTMITDLVPNLILTSGWKSIAIQPDGKIVATGTVTYNNNKLGIFLDNDIVLARFLPNGAPDESFGSHGRIITELGYLETASAIAVQADGKIVVDGYQTNNFDNNASIALVVRYNTDGSLDNSFGNGNGYVTYTQQLESLAYSLVIQPDGKIVAGGSLGAASSTFLLVRYLPNGTLDASFGSGGAVATFASSGGAFTYINSLALDDKGRIAAAGVIGFGSATEVLRYLPDGELDNSFNKTGELPFTYNGVPNLGSFVSTILAEPGDKLVVSSGIVINPSGLIITPVLSGLNEDGSPDLTFGVAGQTISNLAFSDFFTGAVMQSDGKIVVAGNNYNYTTLTNTYLLSRYLGYPVQVSLAVRIKRYLQNHGITWNGLPADDKIAYYSVEQSSSNRSGFLPIAKLSGRSNLADYSFTNSQLLQGTNYYRIKAVSTDGTIRYSEVVSADNITNSASIYPNPASNSITVKGLPNNETANISIKDGSGTVLSKGVSNGSTQYRSSLANLQPGTYYMNITTTNKTETLKFVKE